MDGHGDADAHVEGVGNRYIPQPPLFRKESEYRAGHRERDGGMRRRPTPENPTAQEAESKSMTQIGANEVRGMGAAGNRLVAGSYETADNFSLTDSPADQTGTSISGKVAKRNKGERQKNRQKSTDMNGGEH